MLGRKVCDPDGIEGPAGETAGLGLLDVETVMTPDKRLSRVKASHAGTGLPVEGYEIHIGRSHGPDCARPFARIKGRDEGAISAGGRICGSYLHGLFHEDAFRRAYLGQLGIHAAARNHAAGVETVLDALADHVEAHLDVPGLLALAR
jgi:adenosylcobyric acid synthase